MNEEVKHVYVILCMCVQLYVCRRAIVRLHNLYSMTAQRTLGGFSDGYSYLIMLHPHLVIQTGSLCECR